MEDELGSEKIEDEDVDYSQFEEKFFEEVRKGKDYQHFLSLSSQYDCMLIRSILASMDIPTYIEGDKVNKLYGGVYASVTSDFKIKLYILLDDYDDALEAVEDYLKSKIDSEPSVLDRNKALQILELLLSSSSPSKPRELLGISIIDKKSEV
ncbi:MAG: hypothetical protein K5930_05370 [Treponemataceae bacterium]|nr:hypothetical protein [Treponemataceae bacterium]